MGYEAVYKCDICGHLNVLYDMSNEPDKKGIGHKLFYYCENGCVFSEDEHCKIKGKSRLTRVF